MKKHIELVQIRNGVVRVEVETEANGSSVTTITKPYECGKVTLSLGETLGEDNALKFLQTYIEERRTKL